MLFHAVASFARRRALMLSALVQHVPLGKPLFRSVLPDLVGMNVLVPVDPGSPPGCVVDNYWVRAPIKAAFAEIRKGKLHLEAIVADPDGSTILRESREGNVNDPGKLGNAVGETLLGRGGDKILEAVYERGFGVSQQP